MNKIDLDKLIILTESIETPNYKYLCSEKIKNDIQSKINISDDFFQVLPQILVADGDNEKIYIFPIENNKPIKVVFENNI